MIIIIIIITIIIKTSAHCALTRNVFFYVAWKLLEFTLWSGWNQVKFVSPLSNYTFMYVYIKLFLAS